MIRDVAIRRFKRFESETLDVSGHVILAGPNNCGKTTVLQAVAAWALELLWKDRSCRGAVEIELHLSDGRRATMEFMHDSTEQIGGMLQEGGVHGMNDTRFREIAASMVPEEVHPEVREKLDFIQRAFGL